VASGNTCGKLARLGTAPCLEPTLNSWCLWVVQVPGWKPESESKSTLRWIAPLQQGGVWNPILQ
jgi:hypothetical protein